MTGGSSKSRGALEVILFEDARFRGSMMFTSAEVTLGSDPGVMIRLEDPSVSACHAVLLFDGDTCTVANYDELVGTLVNDEPIAEQVISATDEIRIGRFRLRITVHKPDATPAPVSVRPPTRPVAAPVRAAAAKPAAPPPPPAPPKASAPSPATAPSMPAPAKPVAPPPLSMPAPAKPVAPPPLSMPALGTRAVPTPASPARATAPSLPAATAPMTAFSPRASATVPAAAPPAPARVPTPPAPAKPVATPPAPARAPTPPAPSKPVAAAAPPPPAPARRTGTAELTMPAPGGLSASSPVPRPSPRTLPVAPAPTTRSSSSHATIAGLPTLPEAPAAPARPAFQPRFAAPAEDVDDDDLEDAFFQPAFSLLDGLLETGAATGGSSSSHAVQVVRFRHDCVLKLRHLRHGEKLRLPGVRKPVGRRLVRGGFVFHRDVLPEGTAISGNGQAIDQRTWSSRADQRGHIALDPATQVVFPLPSGDQLLVQLVPQVAPLGKGTRGPWLTKFMMKVAGISVAVHLLVFGIIGLTSLVRRDFIADNKEGRFARIALKEIELEPPAPPPKPEKEKKKEKAKPEATQTASAETPKVAGPRLPRTRPATPQTQASATAQKLLSALGGLSNSSSKPMSATAMSNLDAVGPVRGGGFKVSGAIGKLPGDSLRLAAAGSGIGRLDTKSSNDVGKNLGKVLGKGPSGLVRAQVTAKPNTMKVEGHLDRGEIQKVINAHIFELQGCFERQLISNPNLAGKVTFEWVIGLNGAVTTVRIKASSLSSNDATSCMQAAIRRWQFPSPRGGQVTVIYPIALANSGS
jgi:predicted component of type VI protein secretion system